MTPPLIGLLPFGLVCGVAAQALGASVWGALGLSAIVFSGAAQIVAAQLLAAQAPVAVIVLTCFVVGLRLMMYSAAMAPHLKPLPAALAQRARVPAHRPGVRGGRSAASASPGDTRNGASYFLGTGVLLWTTWQASNLAGYWLGNVLPAAWSLDFVVPLCFLALLVPALEDGPTRIAALASGIAVVALDALPMRLSLICAGLIGIAAGLVDASGAAHDDERADAVDRHRRRRRRSRTCRGCRSSRCSRAGRCRRSSRRALRFVPAAMLTAIVVPAVVLRGPAAATSRSPRPSSRRRSSRSLVAWRTRSPAATIVAGMVALWLAQWLLRAAAA